MVKSKKFFIVIIFFIYLAVLIKLIVFKYPSGMVVDLANSNFVPLKTILPYLRGSPTWIVARNNLLGNIIPFLPLGFLIPLLHRSISWKHVFGLAVAVNSSIELLQVVSRVGAFDIDDILLNALGAAIGYAIFTLIVRSLLKTKL